jgi:aryl-alcohol dehydrogenase-like predicted oxidoreductase
MQNYAINNNLTPFISMQNHYNIIYREEEREMFPTLKHLGVGALPWSPLAGGLVARPIGDASTTRGDSDGRLKGYNSGEGTKKIISACVINYSCRPEWPKTDP